MLHLLQLRVAAIGRRVRRLLVLYALSWMVGVIVAAAVVWMTVDTLLRFNDHGVRLIGSLVVVGFGGWAVWRFLLPALRQPLDDVVVAQRIERHFSGMGDQLSSSIEFLRQSEDDPLAGSATLRRATIAQLESTALSLDWRRALDRRPVVKAAACAVAISVVAAVLAAVFPTNSRLAFARLVKPLGSDAWPPVNDLAFTKRVDRIARDQPFEVELIDRNHRLPDDVRIQYRAAAENGSLQVEGQRMQRIGDLMVARREKILGPFDYRAEGGDDRKMEWIHVDVVEPPEFDTVQIRLHPPAYTGWSEQASQRRIVALRGTTVELTAHATKPLFSATLHQPSGPEVKLQRSRDGLQWTIPVGANSTRISPASANSAIGWVIDKSGQYWFELRDSEELVGGLSDRWDIQAVADQSPTVAIQSPLGNLAVTPAATLPVKILAKDDLALRSIALVYSRSDHTELGDVVISLFIGPAKVAASGTAISADQLPGVSRTCEYSWELAPLGLPPGAQVLMTAIATDYLPQKGASSPRRLTIITPAELEDRLSQRQSLVYSELGRILKLQQAARLQTSALETQLEQVGKFQKQDIDQLRGAELNQRQIHGALTARTDGVRGIVVSLLEELTVNHVENATMHRRMQGLADELGRLDAAELSAAERDLTAVVKGAQDPAMSSTRTSPAVAQSLLATGRDQDAIAAALERLLGDLAEWNSYRGLTRELTQLRRDLTELEQATKDLGAHTLTQDLRDLSPQQQADLKKLSQRQLDQARQFDKLEQRLEQVSQELRGSDPLASESLADALHIARKQAVGGTLRDAGQQVADNQIGRALAQQTAAGHVLDEMLDALSNRPEQELSRLVEKLRGAEAKLSAVRKDEEGLRKRLREAAKASASPDKNTVAQAEVQAELQRLARRQKEVQEDTQHLAHELQRLQANQAASAAARAGGHMNRAAQGAQRSAAGAASASTADADAAEAEAAEKDLAEAEQQLAAARRQAEADLAHEQLQRLDDSLQALVDRQQHTIVETSRLEKIRIEQTSLTRGQASTVLELSHEQQALATDTGDLASKLTGAEAFQFLLQSAAREMTLTATRLAARDMGSATQQLEQDVLGRLKQLVAALKEDKQSGKSSPAAGNNAGGDGQGPGQRRSLGEVRLIQLMQEDLNRRTRRLNDAMGQGREPDDEQRQQFSDLMQEQQRLAELIQAMAGDSNGKEPGADSKRPPEEKKPQP